MQFLALNFAHNRIILSKANTSPGKTMTADTQPITNDSAVFPMDMGQIIAKHEITLYGKQLLYVPAETGDVPRQLLIVMSTHNQGKNYLAMRSFLENQKHDLLFVTDPQNTWYLDHDYGETFHEIFRKYVAKYSPENVIFFGSSMSGYGALLHALRLNANAVVANPQINLDMTCEHSWPELKEHISDLNGRHINIDEIADDLWKDSVVYVVHGHLEMDVLNLNLLANARLSKKKLIIQTLDIDNHAFPFGRDIKHIYAAASLTTLFRQELNVEHVEKEFQQRDGKIENQRRKEHQKRPTQHPLLTFRPDHGPLWQLRHKYRNPAEITYFSNVGRYAGENLVGAHCLFDGERWRLVAPSVSIEENLIVSDHNVIKNVIKNPDNDQLINANWKIRTHESTEVEISSVSHDIEINLHKAGNNNTFLNLSILPSEDLCEKIQGKYLTFSADVYTSTGEVFITVGGYGTAGYHHTNSSKAVPGRWKTLSAMELFPSIDYHHRDRLFVRINVGSDSKPKQVKISNLKLVVGYFPMGLN